MSFYLDDYPEDDTPNEICPHCAGRDFYTDPITGTLTCSSCYTQSQSQKEEIDIEDGIGLAALSGGKRTKTSSGLRTGGGRGRSARDLHEFDCSKNLPDAESCCLAFQWLLLDASKTVAKLIGLSERKAHSDYIDLEDDGNSQSALETTVKQIWFAYLRTWTEAAAVYSERYPEMRVSFRDLFLEQTRRTVIMRHLNVTIGRRVEEEMIQEMQEKMRDGGYSAESDEKSLDSTTSNEANQSSNSEQTNNDDAAIGTQHRKRKRRAILDIPKLCTQVFSKKSHQIHRHPNGCYTIDPHQAVLRIQPSLRLLLSILQLALMHLQTGVAPYHLTTWTANGLLPHALNGFALLPQKLRERVVVVKKFFVRSYVPPAGMVDDLAFLLAASIGWYGGVGCAGEERQNKDNVDVSAPIDPSNRMSNKQKEYRLIDAKHDASTLELDNSCDRSTIKISIYNVPLLTARMVQDLGFRQHVLDTALALMGLKQERSNKRDLPLVIASPDKLFTPLHVASVIVVACKSCRGWETWIINSLQFKSSDSFVPWNDTELEVLGNGPTLDHYTNFLESTALNGTECSSEVSQFFDSFGKDLASRKETNDDELKPKNLISATVKPNSVLAGVSTPNEPDHSNTQPYSSYSNLIQYVCYTIEETNPVNLHRLVCVLENELLRTNNSL